MITMGLKNTQTLLSLFLVDLNRAHLSLKIQFTALQSTALKNTEHFVPRAGLGHFDHCLVRLIYMYRQQQ